MDNKATELIADLMFECSRIGSVEEIGAWAVFEQSARIFENFYKKAYENGFNDAVELEFKE